MSTSWSFKIKLFFEPVWLLVTSYRRFYASKSNFIVDLDKMHTLILMSAVFAPILLFLAFMANILPQKSLGTFLPSIHNNSKREYEIFTLYYSLFWISIFGIVIVFQLYENFTANSYMSLCSGLAAPLLLQPIVYPMKSEQVLPLHLRYSFKATLWIAIFSFIGKP